MPIFGGGPSPDISSIVRTLTEMVIPSHSTCCTPEQEGMTATSLKKSCRKECDGTETKIDVVKFSPFKKINIQKVCNDN